MIFLKKRLVRNIFTAQDLDGVYTIGGYRHGSYIDNIQVTVQNNVYFPNWSLIRSLKWMFYNRSCANAKSLFSSFLKRIPTDTATILLTMLIPKTIPGSKSTDIWLLCKYRWSLKELYIFFPKWCIGILTYRESFMLCSSMWYDCIFKFLCEVYIFIWYQEMLFNCIVYKRTLWNKWDWMTCLHVQISDTALIYHSEVVS